MIDAQAPVTRGRFITNAAKGSVLLVGTGGVLATMDGVALASGRVTKSDVATLQVAYIAETLAVHVYSEILANFHRFTHPRLQNVDYFRHALINEKDHRAFLHRALGARTPRRFTVQLPARYTKTGQDVLNTGVALEMAFVEAYLGAVETLSSTELKLVAAKVAADEATHYSFFDAAAGAGPPANLGGHGVLQSFPHAIPIRKAADTLVKGGFVKLG
jgi:rubrerythrin